MNRYSCGYTLIEVLFATALIGVVGLIIYALLVAGTILGAKNTAINTAHQQARMAMLEMVQDLHSAISLPQLIDENGAPLPAPSPGASPSPAQGISFQLWSQGPYRIIGDKTVSDNTVSIQIPTVDLAPMPGQRLIVLTHQIEDDITAVAGPNNAASGHVEYTLTLAHTLQFIDPASNIARGSAISGTGNPTFYNISCYIAARCSYVVNNQQLQWHGPTTHKAFSSLGSDIMSPTPFSIPTTPAGALYHRIIAAIDLSTTDSKYNHRGFRSANILLNGQVPARARLTTYQ
jgi:prepilin-type N-terminal cleavage/methylation domain-containing protein